METFDQLKLIEPILRAVRAENYSKPTEIQKRAIPHLLDGKDLLGCAQTGTGKTAAYALPILQRLNVLGQRPMARMPRALVLAPTRELAAQITQSFRTYGQHLRLAHAAVYGGVGQFPQVKALSQGVDVLVATPGRLLDLMGQGHVRFDRLEVLVLDEVDQMLDMGFIPDVRRIIAALPIRRQTLLFSATMPDAIRPLAEGILSNPVSVSVSPSATTVELVDQRVFFVERGNKRALLSELLKKVDTGRVLVFTRTKHGADRLTEQLERIQIRAEAIHARKSQSARERALRNFSDGRTRVLVATDIAARGLDIDGVTHVVNYELPNIPESYVHRIGRTARAGARGVAYSFCDSEERAFLRGIQRLIKQDVTVVKDHPYHVEFGHESRATSSTRQGGGNRFGNRPRHDAPQSRFNRNVTQWRARA